VERLRPGDPEQIGPWHIINRLGAGGMGIVYMGNNGTRAAAIKVVRDFLLEDPASRTRLAREVSSLKKVQSKYVAEIVGADVDNSPAWIATNFVDGPSLKTLIEHEGPLTESKWLEFAYGLMSALQAVHSSGVIHRDVKPSNILMSATGPKLIDFGISFSSDATSLTRTGMVAGTPTWFSPEQFESTKITSAVDNFAAGSVLYFAATGESPWGKEDTSVANTMHFILNRDADMSLLTPNQKEVISLLHKKSPKERSTAEEIIARLEHLNHNLAEGSEGKARSWRSAFSLKTNVGRFVIGTIMLLIAGGVYINDQYQPFAQNDLAPIASPSATPVEVTKWKLEIVGDSEPQNGSGDNYSLFICDQGVIKDSLKLRELTNPPAKSQPEITLLKGDERCGKDFDTILIEGKIDKAKNRRNYVLAGSTATGFIIQYEYNISITN
jgi:serine/threonine protein kinase